MGNSGSLRSGLCTRSYPYPNTRGLSGMGTGIAIPEYPILVRLSATPIPENPILVRLCGISYPYPYPIFGAIFGYESGMSFPPKDAKRGIFLVIQREQSKHEIDSAPPPGPTPHWPCQRHCFSPPHHGNQQRPSTSNNAAANPNPTTTCCCTNSEVQLLTTRYGTRAGEGV